MNGASSLGLINTNICSDEHKNPKVFSYNCIHYVVEGYGYLKIQDRLFTISEGQTFFVPQGVYAAHWSESKNGYKYIWIAFDEWNLFQEVLHKTAFSQDTPICETTKEQMELFHMISTLKWKMRNGGRYHIIGLVIQLLATYIETFPSSPQLSEDHSFQSIITFINNNLSRTDLNIDMLVKASGLSRSTLHNRFNKEVGISPGAYICKARLLKAKHLLYTTDFSIRQISRAVGYDDPLYFSHLFHTKNKRSPTEYRNRCRNIELKKNKQT